MGYYINPGYEEHINQYNVLSLDITGFMGETDHAGLPAHLTERILWDMEGDFPDIRQGAGIRESLMSIVHTTGNKTKPHHCRIEK